MRRQRVFTWHVHGSYLWYLTHAAQDFYVPVKPGRPEGYGGRAGSLPWPENLHEVPAEDVRHLELDCVLFQSRHNYLLDQYEILSDEQQRLPRIYLEHDPPRQHPTDTQHVVDDPNVLLVHVTHFNALMWDSGRTPTRVIEHGVIVARAASATPASSSAAIVVVNDLSKRGRRLGADVFERVRREVPLDLVGMGVRRAGRRSARCRARRSRSSWRSYRFFFNPIRYTSLGLAVCEAMMLGMPIVGLATTEMATVIENGVSGYIDTDARRLIARDAGAAARSGRGAAARRGARRTGRASGSTSTASPRDWDAAFALVTRDAADGRSADIVTEAENGMTKRIALISEHASPLGMLGGVDSGGQNVYVGQVAQAPRGRSATRSTSSPAATASVCRRSPSGSTACASSTCRPGPADVRAQGGAAAATWREFTAYVLQFCRTQRRAYDLVHANFWMSGLVACEVKRALGIPFVDHVPRARPRPPAAPGRGRRLPRGALRPSRTASSPRPTRSSPSARRTRRT